MEEVEAVQTPLHVDLIRPLADVDRSEVRRRVYGFLRIVDADDVSLQVLLAEEEVRAHQPHRGQAREDALWLVAFGWWWTLAAD